MQLVLFGALFVLICFAFVVLFGAPYVPTLSPQVKTALDLIDLKKGQTLLELGSGDGRVLRAAAQRGLRVVGYELNPLLVVYSRLTTWKYRKQVRIVWGNFWNVQLPECDGVFVFLLDRYMRRLDQKITKQARGKTKLVSFAFEIPGKRYAKRRGGLFLYLYD